MTQSLDSALAALGDDRARILAPKAEGDAVRLILDVTGLNAAQREALEVRVRGAFASFADIRIALAEDKAARTLIAIGSGKGGVGKSTLSANLAVALARMGYKVGLVDADIYGPSQPQLMGVSGKPEAKDNKPIPVEAHGVKMLSIGQLVEPGAALAWRGPMVSSALGQLLDAHWGDTELLLIDLPPGTGDVQLSLVQKHKPAGAVIVSTPQDLALIDAARAIDLFGKTDVPVIGLIENMAGYRCPHCGEASDPFGAGGAELEAERLDIPFLGRIPLTLDIRAESDAGTPPAASDGPEADAFRAIAEALLERLNLAPARGL